MSTNAPTNEIRFFHQDAPYGYLSNFSLHAIIADGVRWPTTEHYFQAQKFRATEPDYAERIRDAPSAKLAAQLGRDRGHPLRSDWNAVKDDVMRIAVIEKFTQHYGLGLLLLGTGSKRLVERTTTDIYWGVGPNGVGKNMLGVILMEVRAVLEQEHDLWAEGLAGVSQVQEFRIAAECRLRGEK